MPRRGKIVRRDIPPDPRFQSITVQQFINKVMWSGKKSTAEKIVYDALDMASERLKRPPMEVFDQPCEMLALVSKSSRVGLVGQPIRFLLKSRVIAAQRWPCAGS